MKSLTKYSAEEILAAADFGCIICDHTGESVSRGTRRGDSFTGGTRTGWSMSDDAAFRFADVIRIESMPGFKIIHLST